MNIHEFQAKELFRKYQIPVLSGRMVTKAEDARSVAKKIGGNVWVIKAQIHAGGRGKGGGVKLARSLDEVEAITTEILGMNLITHQTGAEGKIVRKVYIEAGADIVREYYLGLVLDRTTEKSVFIASTEGGVEIEKVAAEAPEKIVKVGIDSLTGFQPHHARMLGFQLGLDKAQLKSLGKFAAGLYKLYLETDCSLAEINPLILTDSGEFIALDAKMNFDDNALFRHQDILAMRDFDEEEPTELEAGKYGLSYVKLDGNVGCMVNGAGLAMSTMDIIKHEGGEPANFLDVGGGANAETVAKGFELILADKNVKAIFVNIFGGIVRCDRIANGILEATGKTKVDVPLIVRLDGTNAVEAAKILREANIQNIITASDLADGARKAVAAAHGK
ncbi:MAG: ADP-forming succinate--CoA ligase subunit beta [Candidatus Cloacimonetes bacterium]|nr:ADP-forming succinate--CoA ligase subunit beta [Candidatus Cloacimonadota bacterium]